jgi:hypothetical protein
MSSENMKEVVKENYGKAALRMTTSTSCCGAGSSSEKCCDVITGNLYDSRQTSQIPEKAVLASLGCGNPTALTKLNPGETVLDLVRIRRRHRRFASSQAGGPGRQGLRSRHDG